MSAKKAGKKTTKNAVKVRRSHEWIKTPCTIRITAPASERRGLNAINRQVLQLELNEDNKVLVEWVEVVK